MKGDYKCQSFIDAMVNEVPRFDDIILSQMRFPKFVIIPIRKDVRLLPNKQRREWLVFEGYIKGKKSRKPWRELNVQDNMTRRLSAWLKSLPPKRRKLETKIRRRKTEWIGNLKPRAIHGLPKALTCDTFKVKASK